MTVKELIEHLKTFDEDLTVEVERPQFGQGTEFVGIEECFPLWVFDKKIRLIT